MSECSGYELIFQNVYKTDQKPLKSLPEEIRSLSNYFKRSNIISYHHRLIVKHNNFCPFCYKQFIVHFLKMEGSIDITILK